MSIAVLLALRLSGLGFEGPARSVLIDSPERLGEIADRRGPVVGVSLLAWLGALGLVLAVTAAVEGTGALAGRTGRVAARLLALSLVYLPLVLLATAALESSVAAERLVLMLGAPVLAGLTLTALGGYSALAFACAATVLAYTVDVIAGSPLTQLSLVGPNPAAGHRFYGIGNELEAILVVLALVGTGAALLTYPTLTTPGCGQCRVRRMRGPAAFLVVAAVLAFVFAYGRYGADVGAAITLPLGAAVAAALLVERPRLALLAFFVPLPALALLAAADLLTGSDAHLTKEVLQADSGGDVLAVFGHRLREAGESFGRPLLIPGLPVVIVSAVVAWLRRDRIAAWLRGVPAMRAGLSGALAATLMGTIANDSGALLLEIGAAYLLVFLAFAWAEADDQPGRYP
ncbi:MAG TPA: hypothetical protein VNM89_07040 [Solirubrobacterales bacterium]|nr:hypothetical protein [Solirubrobacterales bacterium]